MFEGGYIKGPWWRFPGEDDDETRRCFVVAWGNLIRDPQETYKDSRHVRFVIKCGRGAGRSERYLVCDGWGQRMTATVMAAMEKNDVVLCAGQWKETIAVSKRKKTLGQRKPVYAMRVNFIIPMGLVAFLLELYSAPKVRKLVEDRKNEDADTWESD